MNSLSHSFSDRQTIGAFLQQAAPSLREYVRTRIPSNLQSVLSADDVLQDAWIDAFRGLPRLGRTTQDQAGRWMTTLVERKLLNALKAARAIRRGGNTHKFTDLASGLAALWHDVATTSPTPGREAARSETFDVLQIAMATLPEDRRRVLRMHYIEGQSYEQIAEAIERPRSAVHRLMLHGLRQLHETMGSASSFLTDVPLTSVT